MAKKKIAKKTRVAARAFRVLAHLNEIAEGDTDVARSLTELCDHFDYFQVDVDRISDFLRKHELSESVGWGPTIVLMPKGIDLIKQARENPSEAITPFPALDEIEELAIPSHLLPPEIPDDIVDLDTAHKMLGIFGITSPTPEYKRSVKEYGFGFKAFENVLVSASEYIIGVDWRGHLAHDFKYFEKALRNLGEEIAAEFDSEGHTATVRTKHGSTTISYKPSDDKTFDGVIHALQGVISPQLQFRADPHNAGNDTWFYAVLPVDEWEELEQIAPKIIKRLFV